MELISSEHAGIKIIELHGDLDGNSAPQLQEEIEKIVTSDCNCLALNMTDCEFVSSAGLRVLLISAKLLKKNNGVVVLSNLSEDVKDIMEMTGFEPYFEYQDSIDECFSTYGGK